MDVGSIEKLYEMGFNTPVFVKNPLGLYGKNVYMLLKHQFGETEGFTVVGVRDDKKKKKYLSGLGLQVAVSCLDDLALGGFDTVIFKDVPVDFQGLVMLNGAEKGSFYVRGFPVFYYNFLRQIESVMYRHIARTVGTICHKLNHERVWVDYIWSKDFQGSRGSKLVVTDFEKL